MIEALTHVAPVLIVGLMIGYVAACIMIRKKCKTCYWQTGSESEPPPDYDTGMGTEKFMWDWLACNVDPDKMTVEINAVLRSLSQGEARVVQIRPSTEITVNILAEALHEAGREAVEKGNTVAADHHGEKTRKFIEWNEITEGAREGRRIQARWLLKRFVFSFQE